MSDDFPARLGRSAVKPGKPRPGWRKWTATAFLVMIAAVGTVSGIALFAKQDNALEKPADCVDTTFSMATVHARVNIVTANLSYPRVTSDVRVRLPRTVPGAAALTFAADVQTRRDAVACLLGSTRGDFEIRDAEPRVTVKDGVIEVAEHSYADIIGPSITRAGIASIYVSADKHWGLTVSAPSGLKQATWDVAVSAPESWLSSPLPWEPADIQATEIRWGRVLPAGVSTVATASVTPDTLALTTIYAASKPWSPYIWGLPWLSTMMFVLVAMRSSWKLRSKIGARRTALRALWPLPFIVFAMGALAIFDAIVVITPITWPVTGPWFIDIGLSVLAATLAWVWWLPRTLAVLAGLASLGFLVAIRLAGGASAYGRDAPVPIGIQVLQLAMIFVVTLVLIMALGKAVHVLLGKGRRRTVPPWLWCVGALGAATLVVEKVAIIDLTQARREWLGGIPHAIDPGHAYRYYLWDLFDQSTWVLSLVAAAALWHQCVRHRFDERSRVPLFTATALFWVGPMWWDIEWRGVVMPIWLLGIPLTLAGRWLLMRRRPALTETKSASLATSKRRGQVGLRLPKVHRSRHVVTSVDVLLARGPGKDSRANAIAAARLAAVPAFFVGVGLCLTSWLAYPLLVINQEDSIVVHVIDDLGWELAKWGLVAAALGLAWRHLPGRRGVIKVLPVISLYAVGPVALVIANWASNGTPDWLPLGNVAGFAVVLLLVGLRMDRAVLDRMPTKTAGTIQAYGLENVTPRLTALLTPVLLVLAVWSAVHGGDVSFPSVDSTRLTRP